MIFAEFRTYLTSDFRTEMVIDANELNQIHISLNITFHALSCEQAKLDVMDVAGTQVLDLAHLEIQKQRLDSNGRYLGRATVVSNRSPEPPVVQMLRAFFPGINIGGLPAANMNPNNEGCQVAGTLHVNKVAGNLHFAIGQTVAQGNRHVHHFTLQDLQHFNISHTIHHLTFGAPAPAGFTPLPNQLDGTVRVLPTGTGLYQYFTQLVPTTYVRSWGRKTHTYQFSVTEDFKSIDTHHPNSAILPGLFIMFDLSPFAVRVSDQATTFLQFLTSLCAIVGGVVTVAGLIDSIIFHASSSGESAKPATVPLRTLPAVMTSSISSAMSTLTPMASRPKPITKHARD
jgi:hypothetical protein